MQDMAGTTQADPVASHLSRWNILKFAGAAATSLAASGAAWAQVPEEANAGPLDIVRKGIDKVFEVFNIDILEEEAKKVYSERTYVSLPTAPAGNERCGRTSGPGTITFSPQTA